MKPKPIKQCYRCREMKPRKSFNKNECICISCRDRGVAPFMHPVLLAFLRHPAPSHVAPTSQATVTRGKAVAGAGF